MNRFYDITLIVVLVLVVVAIVVSTIHYVYTKDKEHKE